MVEEPQRAVLTGPRQLLVEHDEAGMGPVVPAQVARPPLQRVAVAAGDVLGLVGVDLEPQQIPVEAE